MSALELAMSDESCANPVLLRWSALSYLDMETLGPMQPADDGRIGIIGARLMEVDNGDLGFDLSLIGSASRCAHGRSTFLSGRDLPVLCGVPELRASTTPLRQ